MTGPRHYRMAARRLALVAVALLALATPLARPARAGVAPPSAAALLAEVETLAAPAMDGRASGTEGGRRAARHIAEAFRAAGLRPGGEAGTYVESFPVATGMRLAPSGQVNALERLAGDRKSFKTGDAWLPHGGAPNADVSGELVFAGHGVVAPGQGQDDYRGLDVRGRIVMVFAGTPAHLSGARWSRLDKLIAARERGAAGLLLVDDTLPSLDATATRFNLPSATVTPAAADALLAPTGRPTAGLSASFATGVQARLAVALTSDERRGVNVVGILPGRDPALAGEAVVVGAHYDHLGQLAGSLYPGADDNASGTAVVLGLARAFAAAGGMPRTLVFALFGGEELGLLGSQRHVSEPSTPERVVAMLNFDMVGRLRDALSVGGVDTAPVWRGLLARAAKQAEVDVKLSGGPFAPSDHLHFYRAGAPVLFFTTGTHGDYHSPADTADKINAAGLARIAALASQVVEGVAAAPAAPTYVKLEQPAEKRAPPAPAARGGAFLGVVSRGRGGDGVPIADVVPGSTAARLGLAGGDVIVRVGDRVVETFNDLRDQIRARRPGERISIVYLRDGDPHRGVETLGTAQP